MMHAPFTVGMKTEMAGLSTPSSDPRTNIDVAMAAPELPAVITATASPLLTSSLAMRMDESRFLRKTVDGESSISTT